MGENRILMIDIDYINHLDAVPTRRYSATAARVAALEAEITRLGGNAAGVAVTTLHETPKLLAVWGLVSQFLSVRTDIITPHTVSTQI